MYIIIKIKTQKGVRLIFCLETLDRLQDQDIIHAICTIVYSFTDVINEMQVKC